MDINVDIRIDDDSQVILNDDMILFDTDVSIYKRNIIGFHVRILPNHEGSRAKLDVYTAGVTFIMTYDTGMEAYKMKEKLESFMKG